MCYNAYWSLRLDDIAVSQILFVLHLYNFAKYSVVIKYSKMSRNYKETYNIIFKKADKSQFTLIEGVRSLKK